MEEEEANADELADQIPDLRRQVKETLQIRDKAIESSLSAIAISDLAGNLFFVNPAFLQMWGYDDASEILGKSAVQFWQVESKVEDVIKALPIQKRWRGELTAVRKDGTTFDAQVMASMVVGEAGAPLAMMASFVDITDRKRAEKALQESEARFRALFDAMVEGVALHEILYDDRGSPVDYVISGVNPAFQSHTGIAPENAVGRKASELYGTGEAPYLDIYERVAATGKSIQFETYFPPMQKHFRISVFSPGKRQFATVFEDITERVRAETALRQRTAQLEALRKIGLELTAQLDLDVLLRSIASRAVELLEGTDGGLYLYRPERDVLEWAVATGPNPAPLGALLQRGEGTAGKVWETGQPLIMNQDLQREGQTSLYEGHPSTSRVEVPIRWGTTGAKDEFLGVLNVNGGSARPFSQADVELLEMFAAQAAIAIKNARLMDQARQDAETKAALLYEVNHRLGNTLSFLISVLHLEQRRAETEAHPDYAAILQDMTNRIRALGRLHQMLSETDWAPLRLSDLSRWIVEPILQMAPPDKYASVDVTPSEVRVNSRQAHKVALVINELATNTIKHTLQARQAAHIDIHIASEEGEQGTCILVEFRDDGPGYPEDVLSLERCNTGLRLVRTWVCYDLGGSLVLRNERGAVATIHFKVES